MQGDKTKTEHAALMGRMAQTLGVDLDEAELRGALPPEMRDDMVLACTGCADPMGCRKWLAANDKADRAPGYCRNADELVDLRG